MYILYYIILEPPSLEYIQTFYNEGALIIEALLLHLLHVRCLASYWYLVHRSWCLNYGFQPQWFKLQPINLPPPYNIFKHLLMRGPL